MEDKPGMKEDKRGMKAKWAESLINIGRRGELLNLVVNTSYMRENRQHGST